MDGGEEAAIGNLEGALRDGTMQAALARLRAWRGQRPHTPPIPPPG